MNDENIVSNSESINESVPPDEVSSVIDEINNEDYETILVEVQQINQRVESIGNSLIVAMVGIGILVGIGMAVIFSHFFRS